MATNTIRLCIDFAQEIGVEITKASQIICYAIYHGEVFVDTFSTEEISPYTLIRPLSSQKKPPFKSILEELLIKEPSIETISSSNQINIQTKELTSKFIPEKYRELVNKRLEIVEE